MGKKNVFVSIKVIAILMVLGNSLNANNEVGIWMKFEKEFTSVKEYENPLYEVEDFTISFTSPSGKTMKINGFWDGGMNWKVRFMPNELGEWTYTTKCSDKSNTGLNQVSGSFECVEHRDTNKIYTAGSIKKPDGSYHMTHADGAPFFWAACTAWNGALKATEDEWELYLQDRVEKQYSVIQFVTTQWRGADSDRKGQVAFTGSGRIEINPGFFQDLDARVDQINEWGLVAAPVLLWALPFGQGRHLSPGYYLPQNEAILLAKYIVARYGGNHVVWILGGDGRYVKEYEQRWKNIGREVFGGEHPGIVAQHPHGRSWIGSDYADEEWLDVVGYQSSHSISKETVNWINVGPPSQEWDKTVPKAILNMEPIYEQIRENATAKDIRNASYWSLFATPISGISYGANGIWPWLREGEGILNHGSSQGTDTWEESLSLPGGEQIGYLSDFIQKFKWWDLMPANEGLLVEQPGEKEFNHFISVVSSYNRKTVLAYIPLKSTFKLYNPLRKNYRFQWFNPITNQYSGWKTMNSHKKAILEFTSPGEKDMILILNGD